MQNNQKDIQNVHRDIKLLKRDEKQEETQSYFMQN